MYLRALCGTCGLRFLTACWSRALRLQCRFDHIVRIPLPPDATDQAVSAANSRESNEKLQSAKDLLESHAKEHGSQGYLVRTLFGSQPLFCLVRSVQEYDTCSLFFG